jgi:hypothetical protein
MRIAVTSDHAGYALFQLIVAQFQRTGRAALVADTCKFVSKLLATTAWYPRGLRTWKIFFASDASSALDDQLCTRSSDI